MGRSLVAVVAASVLVQDLVAGRTVGLACTHSLVVAEGLVYAEGAEDDQAVLGSSWCVADVVEAAGLGAVKLCTRDASLLVATAKVRAEIVMA
jgi:inner membrane protein involved in colicin E2 resistance